jgi:Protein of unknown function (DUF2911)
MKRRFGSFLLLSASLFLAPALLAQGTTSQATATCSFNATKQLVVEYQRMAVNSKKSVFGHAIPYNKVWAPGGKPMTMFVNAPVTVVGKDIPIGAYTMFVIPSEKQWTLIISRSTDTSGKYDEHDDLVRVPMQYGELESPEDQFSVYFTHSAPGECGMRLDLENSRAWVTFQEK